MFNNILLGANEDVEIVKTVEEEKYYLASQWQLIWRKFKRHKLALIGGVIILILYFIALFCEFLSPYTMESRFDEYKNTPPTKIYFFDEKGRFSRPYIYKVKQKLNPKTFRYEFEEDRSQKYYIYLLKRGESYKFWGILQSNLHFFGTEDDAPIFLFGTDALGRDLFTRCLYGARVSLSVGLVGIFLSFSIGLILGGISGYYGDKIDELIQRTIDFLISIPSIPIWMALSAALPRDWPIIKTYFAITLILSLVSWCGLARVVRGKLLSLREEEFTIAARLAGASEWRIITRHLLPSFASHLIVSITLSIPGMILGETALSFLGLGLRPPAVSWGVLLQDAQKLESVAVYPWRIIPTVFVILTVLAFNFLGDGLRDAADPYSR